MYQTIRAVWRDERATAAVEYALVAALVGMGMLFGVNVLVGDEGLVTALPYGLKGAFKTIANQL